MSGNIKYSKKKPINALAKSAIIRGSKLPPAYRHVDYSRMASRLKLYYELSKSPFFEFLYQVSCVIVTRERNTKKQRVRKRKTESEWRWKKGEQ